MLTSLPGALATFPECAFIFRCDSHEGALLEYACGFPEYACDFPRVRLQPSSTPAAFSEKAEASHRLPLSEYAPTGQDACPPTSEHVPADVGAYAYRAEACARRRRNMRLPGRDICPPTSEYVPLRGLPAPAVRNRLHGIIFRFLIAISIETDSWGSISLNEEPSARSSYRLNS